MKLCSKCKTRKALDAFYDSNRYRLGTSWCRDCFTAYMRERRAKWTPPTSPPATKRCGHCKAIKPSSEFGRLRGTSSGLHSWCRACQSVRAKQRRALHPDKARKIKYGMEAGLYDRLASEQGHACAICRRHRKLVVDHDHVTGAIRGLLCKPCNSAIGFFEDLPDVVQSAHEYLKHHKLLKTA